MTEIPTINRYAITVKPTDVYLAWAAALPDAEPGHAQGTAELEATVYLIPEDIEPGDYLNRRFKAIFEEELAAWCTNMEWRPESLNLKLFREFFQVQFSTMVYDLGKDSIETDD